MKLRSTIARGALGVSALALAVACGAKDPPTPKTEQDEPAHAPAPAGRASSSEPAAAPVAATHRTDASAAEPGAATAALRIALLVQADRVFPLACWNVTGSSWSTPAACVAELEAAKTIWLGHERYTIVETIEDVDDTTGVERVGVKLDRAGPREVFALSGVAAAALTADFGHTRREIDPAATAELPPAQRRAVAKAVGVDADSITFLQSESADIDGDGAAETLVSVYAATGGGEELGLDTTGFVVAVTAGTPPTATRVHAAPGARLRILGLFDVNQDDTAEVWIYRIRDEYEDEVVTTVVGGKPKVIGSYCCHL